ncbi:MAG: J domain-containing protein [Acidobacteriota bacterium]|jgi:curved DNA-binding protein CbpA|nr:J domain-containing protein [Acidobacteriota bacterium]
MNKQKDFYWVLRVNVNATPEEIKNAYLNLAKAWHPDKHHSSDEAGRKTAEEMFKNLSEAYSVLSNAAKRADYDLTLRDHEPGEPDYKQYARQAWGGPREDPVIANEALKNAFLDALAAEKRNAGEKYATFSGIFREVRKGRCDEKRYAEEIRLTKADALNCANTIQFIIDDAKKKKIRLIDDDLKAADDLKREVMEFIEEASSLTFKEAVRRMSAQGEHGLVVHSTDLYKLLKPENGFWEPHNVWIRLKLYEQINLGISEYNNRKIMEQFLDKEEDAKCIEIFKMRVLDNIDMFTISEMKAFYRKTGCGEKSRGDILKECNITAREVLKHRSLRVLIDNTPIHELTMSVNKAEQQRKDSRAWYERLVMKSNLFSELKKPFGFNFGDVSENSTDWRKKKSRVRN